MLTQFLFRAFSTTANSFKSRSKLTEFYKATHPDLLNNAPDNVKQENARSLQFLNQYLDALSQNQLCNGVDLTFYVASKSNKKARVFHPIQIQLDPYKEADVQHQKDTIDKVSKSLVQSVQSKQEDIDTAHVKKKGAPLMQASWFTNLTKVKQDILDETTFLKKEKTTPDLLQPHLFFEATQAQYQELKKQVGQQMWQANAPHTKPKDWANLVLGESGHFKNLFSMFSDLLDPRLIYVDNDVSVQEVEIFRTLLVPNKQNLDTLTTLKQVFASMEKSSPQISLYVTKHYGSEDIAGYFSIPYNFEAKEMLEQYKMLRHRIIQERKEFERELANLEQVKQKLVQNLSLNLTVEAVSHTLKNVSKVQEIKFTLLKLSRYLSETSFNVKSKPLVITNNLKQSGKQNDLIFLAPNFTLDELVELCR